MRKIAEEGADESKKKNEEKFVTRLDIVYLGNSGKIHRLPAINVPVAYLD